MAVAAAVVAVVARAETEMVAADGHSADHTDRYSLSELLAESLDITVHKLQGCRQGMRAVSAAPVPAASVVAAAAPVAVDVHIAHHTGQSSRSEQLAERSDTAFHRL